MHAEIREEPLRFLEEHARISIAFEVASVLELTVQDRGFSEPAEFIPSGT